MLQFIVAGLVLGGIYAITATGLVVTYQSAGVLNFSFGALAYTIARFYYFLHSQHGWPILPAAVVAILGLGPALGLFLYAVLFRFLRLSSTLIKVLATIGLSVALPPADTVILGNQQILEAPGLAPEPVKVFHVIGVPVTLDQIIVYACVIILLLAGFFVLRYTDVGLQIRAIVDTAAMTSLSGTNPGRMSTAVWAVSSTLAGLAGVLVAPVIGLDPTDMTLLMVTAFAAVVAAKLRSLPVAVIVGLGMGIASALIQYYLPPASAITADVLEAIPFIVIALVLIYYTVRGESLNEASGIGGALDRAIRPQGGETAGVVDGAGAARLSWRPSAFAFICLLGLPLILHGFWVGLVAQGLAYGVIFLSFTLVTGEGGMIWLCQATFAGGGGMLAALLTLDHGVPILFAVLIGGLAVVPFGILVGFLTIGMGDLYVAVATLTFGLLVENTLFIKTVFSNNGAGTNVNPPGFISGHKALAYLGIVVFAVIALLIVNLRRSTTGLGLSAVRSSPTGSRTLGISVVQMKVIVAGLAAFVAGIGGGLLAITLGVALPTNYTTLGGAIWLAVLVTQGIRSNTAAVLAGLSQTVLAGVAITYLPQIFGNFIPILFGLGAIGMVKFPEGVLTMQARQLRSVFSQVRVLNPKLYGQLKVAAAVYFVVFVVLVITVQNLWWVWLAITFVVGNAGTAYLIARYVRHPKPVLIPAEFEQQGVVAGAL